MASRNNNISTKKLDDGRVVYKTKIYPNIPLKDGDIYVATQDGDRLDSIANQFYGDSSLWWIIASANNIHGGNIGLDDGTVLRVPEDYLGIISDFNRNI